MNTKNLILTPIGEMSRQDWLDFRNPVFHIKKFTEENWFPGEKPSWQETPEFYSDLKKFFELNVDWKNFIFPTVGASEIASLLGLNPYKSIIELYFEKVGAKPVPDFDNAAMFWGRELEEQVAQKWQYWDGSVEGMIENFKAENIIRKCRRINSYCQNIAFPYIFVSLDRVINKGKSNKEGSLECKTISGFSANMWESGIPPMYVVQLQTQIGVFEFDYGEIALLEDGRGYEVFPFDEHKGIQENIIREGKKFFDIVKEGAKEFLLHTYCPDDSLKQIHYSNCENLAPEPDGSVAYQDYLSNRYKATGTEIEGTDRENKLALSYAYYNEKKKEIETAQIECSNKLKAVMKENIQINLPDGKATWKENSKGSRTFLVKVKLPEGYTPVKAQEEVEVGE